MEKITIDDINKVLDKRYVNLLETPVFSKEELIELVKDIDYDSINRVLKRESIKFDELKNYAELAEMYLEISPERTMDTYKKKFTKEEIIEIVRNFFSTRYPELFEDFEKKLITSRLEPGEKNEYNRDGIVTADVKDDGNTVDNLFTVMHEFTHSVGGEETWKKNCIRKKLAELTTLINEFEFMNYLVSFNDTELSVDAISYMLYSLSDTKYMGLTILFENDLAKIYEKNGKVDFDGMKEYIESLDLTTKKGMMFLQCGNQFLDSLFKRRTLNYFFQGRYIIGELLGSELFLKEDHRENFVRLCKLLGRNDVEHVSEADLQELHSLGIDILDNNAILHVGKEEKEKYRNSFSKLSNIIKKMELEKIKELLLCNQLTNNEIINDSDKLDEGFSKC